MIETGLVLGLTATHLGVPLADLVTWAVVLALLVTPIQLDDVRRQMAARKQNSEIGGAKPRSVVARRQSAPVAVARHSEGAPAAKVVVPATKCLSAADQWQAVSRLVNTGAERAMAVARDQQAIRRELDSLDFTLENMRRELAAVMTMPAVARSAELVPVRVARKSRALAA
jgi:hypothetical protein